MANKRFLLLTILVLLPLVFPIVVTAEEAPEGYDENTEVTLRGTVRDVLRMRGPVVLRMAFQDRVYNVVTAPPWFLMRENISFQQGDELEVTGSKTYGKDGQIYIVARRLKELKTGREFPLRNGLCYPLWRGMGNR